MQELADFDILYGPAPSENHSMMILNGKRQSSNSYTFTYTLMPKKVGTFKIPPVTAKIDGANYTSNALEIKVLPQDEKPANNDAAQSSNNGITSDGLFGTVAEIIPLVIIMVGFAFGYKVLRKVIKGASKGKSNV